MARDIWGNRVEDSPEWKEHEKRMVEEINRTLKPIHRGGKGMDFTVSIWRRRDGLWELVSHTFKLDFVDTDQLADFRIAYSPGTAHPYFLQSLSSETRDALKEQTQGVMSTPLVG